MPDGADAVVRIENCRELGVTVEVLTVVPAGKGSLRRTGEDIRVGDRVLERGTVLGPAELGVLASVGAAVVECRRKPRLSVLSTGDELVDPDGPIQAGQVRNSNAFTVPAQAERAGGDVTRVERVPDDRGATIEAIRDALDADVLIVCGVSRSDRTTTSNPPSRNSAWRRSSSGASPYGPATRPGSASTRTRSSWLLGNPVSAMVTFHLFVPALAALSAAKRGPADDRGPGRALPEATGSRLMLSAAGSTREDGFHVRPTKEQGSHILTPMLGAEALALIEVERGDVAAGERVTIELPSRNVRR